MVWTCATNGKREIPETYVTVDTKRQGEKREDQMSRRSFDEMRERGLSEEGWGMAESDGHWTTEDVVDIYESIIIGSDNSYRVSV